MFTVLFLSLTACDSSESISDAEPPTEEQKHYEASVVVVERAAVLDVETRDADTEAVDAAVLTMEAIGEVLSVRSAEDYRERREISPAFEDICLDVSVDEDDLVLTFDGCVTVDGTVRMRGVDDELVVIFEDDFSASGVDLDGTLSLKANFWDRELSVSGELVYDDSLDLSFSAGMILDDGIAVWGEVAVTGEDEARVALGSAEAPLVWALGCTCPISGSIAAEADVSVDSITIDLDDLIAPGDGADDFSPMVIPIEETDVVVDMAVDFSETCGGHDVSVNAEDITVAVATADLEALVDDMCDSGELSEDECDFLGFAFRYFPETLSFDIAASDLADSAETLLQASFDAICLSWE